MNEKYWKAVVRYGHVGLGKEVSVARFISTGPETSILDVYTLVENMPGVKVRGVGSLVGITRDAYQAGKTSERSNAYLQKLMTHKKRVTQETSNAKERNGCMIPPPERQFEHHSGEFGFRNFLKRGI